MLASIVSLDPIRFEFTFDEASYLRYQQFSAGAHDMSSGAATPVKLKLQKPVRGPKFTFIGWASPHGGSKVHSTRIQIEGNGSLPCPCCGELCGLHHTGVDVYERNEDSEYVTKTEVRSLVDQCDIVSEEISGPSSVSHQLNVSHIKNEGSGNPSARRHGLAIHFYCEHCGDGIELTLAQHKGHSTLEWRLPVGGAFRDQVQEVPDHAEVVTGRE